MIYQDVCVGYCDFGYLESVGGRGLGGGDSQRYGCEYFCKLG